MDTIYVTHKTTGRRNAIIVEDRNNIPQFILDQFIISEEAFEPDGNTEKEARQIMEDLKAGRAKVF